MSPVHVFLMKLAFMLSLNSPPETSLSTVPVPVRVEAVPIAIELGCKSLTFACVEESPQSAQVTDIVPLASTKGAVVASDARIANFAIAHKHELVCGQLQSVRSLG